MFFCTYQRGGAQEDEYAFSGAIDADSFSALFSGLDWREEHEKWRRNTSGSEPTVSVVNREKKSLLWVSCLPDSADVFLLGLVRTLPRRFGRILPLSTRTKKKK
ncbi:hypothetical protein [Chitinivibrio alkaliphilus]|uniref:Uncharacterized protein n=1 Tax=Chitinivibrio alkaliphilus ACht1 TaxID=1313304 RepID=U7DAP3_9BACT|nr:hypothetical protein [Chitinivibrio alkaliphilus]ERP31465.1 hypothetical protein CALK_1669 [Chitinivibrio alkaliphilus ACht1]